MINSVVFALLSVLATITLGYFAARHGDFNAQDNDVLIKLVMKYALPVNVFAGIWGTPRSVLIKYGSLSVWLILASIVCYFIYYFIYHVVRKHAIKDSALYSMSVSDPSVPFIGSALLPFIFDSQLSAIIIGICSLINNIILLPITIYLIDDKASLSKRIIDTLKKPLVFTSLLSFALSFAGLTMPANLSIMFLTFGKVAGGLAMFSIGIVLFTRKFILNRLIIGLIFSKNIIFPGIVLAVMLLFHASSELIAMVVITIAIPTATLPSTIAFRYNIKEPEIASIQFGTTILSFATLFSFILLLR
ncbi:AEC family transporter [Lactobacillaceae bacterium Scapto_B20]